MIYNDSVCKWNFLIQRPLPIPLTELMKFVHFVNEKLAKMFNLSLCHGITCCAIDSIVFPQNENISSFLNLKINFICHLNKNILIVLHSSIVSFFRCQRSTSNQMQFKKTQAKSETKNTIHNGKCLNREMPWNQFVNKNQ